MPEAATLTEWECKGCGVPFPPTDYRQKYCTPRCREQCSHQRYMESHGDERRAKQRLWHRIHDKKSEAVGQEQNCKECGEPIVLKHKRHCFCSDECRWAWTNRRRSEEARSLPPRRHVCEQCGKLFPVNRKDTKFCSPKCAFKNWRLNNRAAVLKIELFFFQTRVEKLRERQQQPDPVRWLP